MKPKQAVWVFLFLAVAVLGGLIVRDRGRNRPAAEENTEVIMGSDGKFILRPANNMNVTVTIPPTNAAPARTGR